MIKPFVYKSLWYVSTVTWKEIEAFSEMVSNNSHPIFTEVANGQIEKGWKGNYKASAENGPWD